MYRFCVVLMVSIVTLSLISCSSKAPIRIDTVGHYNKKKKRTTTSADRTRSTVHVSKPKTRQEQPVEKLVPADRKAIVSTAKKYLNIPYKYGGKSPNSGFDCSGFTSYVYQQNGVNLCGNSNSQAECGVPKKWEEIETGDLLIFGNGNRISHVAIVAHKDDQSLRVLHSTSSRGVVEEDISNSDYWQNKFLFARDVLR